MQVCTLNTANLDMRQKKFSNFLIHGAKDNYDKNKWFTDIQDILTNRAQTP